jgi:hypothetical protein
MPFVRTDDGTREGFEEWAFQFDPENESDVKFKEEQEAYKRQLARAEKAYGRPYWCKHKDRDVTHPSAYWRNDKPDDKFQPKHGVFCHDCGGYIQEG